MAKENKWGMWSLVCGILAIVIPILGFITAILAIIFAIKQRKIEPSGLATAGLIIGIIGLVLNGVYGFMFIGSIVYFETASPDSILPSGCNVNSPLACTEYRVSETDGVSLSIQSRAGTTISINKIVLSCDGGMSLAQAEEGDGGNEEEFSFEFHDVESAGCERLREGEIFVASFSVEYVNEGETAEHKRPGNFRAIVGP